MLWSVAGSGMQALTMASLLERTQQRFVERGRFLVFSMTWRNWAKQA